LAAAQIVCSLKDYSMLYIKADDGIKAELADYFSFYVPGYKFMPAYKNKVWDGKIRLYNRMNGELNAGLYDYVVKFCNERNYMMLTEGTDYGSPLDRTTLTDWDHFIENANLPFKPRDYQEAAAKLALENNKGILLSPTGSGKSFIVYLMVKYWLQYINESSKALIIVPTTSLVEQLYQDFIDYGQTEEDIHRIYSGKDKNFKSAICISTWQSIYKLPKKWFEQFGMIIGDECHGFKSRSLSSICNKAVEAKYRYGCTGTLDGTLTHKLVLEGLFGPVNKVTTTKKLQDEDTLAGLKIKMLLLEYPEEVRKNFGKQKYQDEIDFIIKHKWRNAFINKLTLELKGNTLVLFNRVEDHGKPLFDIINTSKEEKRKAFFVSGEVKTTDREAIRKIVEKQKDAIIVASLGTFSTGINIRNLHNIVFASPSKSQIRVLQSIGRGLRKSDNGKMTQLYDVADDLHWKKHSNYTLLHSIERLKIYKKEQFDFKVIKVNVDE